ncbi:hypothetical protein F5I97DRAFT_1930674 [Phlebopus sp. FC_14]|nr:hypothetical protein F5I97DRAFT_1930674 [Phlebopus sp. FC_14]
MAAVDKVLTGGDMQAAPLQQPPIVTSTTYTVTKLHTTIMKDGPVSHTEWAEAHHFVPALCRRIRHLLRVYYDAVETSRTKPQFKYCDMQHINDGSYTKPVVSSRLDFKLYSSISEGGVWAVKADPESDDDDRERMIELESRSGKDCAAYQVAFFLGDILISFLLNPVNDAKDKLRDQKVMARFVMMSTFIGSRKCSFDFCMRGMPALIGDRAESTCKDGVCKSAVEKLPGKAWAHQTPESLSKIMRRLLCKIKMDGDEFTTTPIFANIMHQIYSRYGLDPLERASRLSTKKQYSIPFTGASAKSQMNSGTPSE